jgi:hypothetical protein
METNLKQKRSEADVFEKLEEVCQLKQINKSPYRYYGFER